MKVTTTFEREDYNAMHDVIRGALKPSCQITDEIIEAVWQQLPENIQAIAIEWGCYDSVFRDDAYSWLKKNAESIKI